MKTINVPLIGSCPRWDEDIPPARLGEFRTLLATVHQEILDAATGLVTPDFPSRLHRTLFTPFVPLPYYAGHYRGVDHARPCLATQVRVGSIDALDYRLVRDYLSDLFERVQVQFTQLELRWAQLSPADRACQLAIAIANLVGGFIQIHPFINGNGRTSRLLWRWCLMRFGVPPQVCTHPRPDPPYASVMEAAMRGDYRPFVIYVLQHLSLHEPIQDAPHQN